MVIILHQQACKAKDRPQKKNDLLAQFMNGTCTLLSCCTCSELFLLKFALKGDVLRIYSSVLKLFDVGMLCGVSNIKS